MSGSSDRVFNFSAGPAVLPRPVLERAQAELLDWRGSGMSVMEVSHRGRDFVELAAESEANLRELLRLLRPLAKYTSADRLPQASHTSETPFRSGCDPRSIGQRRERSCTSTDY